jgi:hypothetical protein
MRKVKKMAMPGIEPGMADTPEPIFEDVDPTTLLVDEVYQRKLSERSVSLIRKMVGTWDWRKFQPPTVAKTDAGLMVLDGQHTAIAAASHPMISKIKVKVVAAPDVQAQAKAFVGLNRDRINLTTTQMHQAAVAAGDEDALTIKQVCERAGVRVLNCPPGGGAFKPGDTMAVTAIGALISRRGAKGAREVLEVLANARCAPVSQSGIRAVECLLYDPEYAGQVLAPDITSALLKLGQAADQEARVFAAAHNVQIWRALTVVLFKGARRGRRRAA